MEGLQIMCKQPPLGACYVVSLGLGLLPMGLKIAHAIVDLYLATLVVLFGVV